MAADKYSRNADKDYSKVAAEKLRVSFDYLDLTLPHFFVHGLVAEHYQKIFDCVNTLTGATEDEIVQQTHSSLSPKSIFNQGGAYERFPERVETLIAGKIAGTLRRTAQLGQQAASSRNISPDAILADAVAQAKVVIGQAFEVRIGKAYGRIHGIVWDKVFYVVWFDPAHNLYPSEPYGTRQHDAFASVKGFDPKAVAALKEAHEEHCANLESKMSQLQAEHDELLKEWAGQ